MKVLQFCNKSPYPAKEGGSIAMHGITKLLLGCGHEVKVIAANTHKYNVSIEDIDLQYRDSTNIDLVWIDTRLSITGAIKALLNGRSYHVERFRSKRLEEHLIEYLGQYEVDVIIFETIYLADYIDIIRKHSNARLILRAHNIEHKIWERVSMNAPWGLKKIYLNILARQLRRFEETVVNNFDSIWCISGVDSEWFIENTDKISVDVIPFGLDDDDNEDSGINFNIDINNFDEKVIDLKSNVEELNSWVVDLKSNVEDLNDGVVDLNADIKGFDKNINNFEIRTLFSIGSMDWRPNVEGIEWFLDEIWDEFHSRHDGIIYKIAGRNMPSDLMRGRKMEGIEIIGEVEDSREFMLGNDVLIVPILSGSGIRIKIIEAMWLGRLVFTTRIGVEGIEAKSGIHLMIADTVEEFLSAMEYCLKNPSRVKEMRYNARQLMRTTHNNVLIGNKMNKLLCQESSMVVD